MLTGAVNTFDFIGAISNAIASLLCLFFSTISIKYLYCQHTEDNKIRRSTIIWSEMCMIFFSITCFIQIATSYLEAREATFIYQIFAGLGNGMWVISQVCHYLVFINRLFYTFQGTKYQISNRTLLIYYILIVLFILNHGCILLVYILDHFEYLYDDQHAALGYAITYCLIEALDLILSIYILYWFYTKLIRLIQDFNDDNTSSHHQQRASRSKSLYYYHSAETPSIGDVSNLSVDSYALQLNHVQKFMVRIMTQYFVLILFGICTTQIFLICRLCAEILLITEDNSDYYTVYSISLSLQAIQCVSNSLSILLIFEFSKTYYKRLCHKFHLYFRLIIRANARKAAIEKEFVHANYQQL